MEFYDSARETFLLPKEERHKKLRVHPWLIKYAEKQEEDDIKTALTANPFVLCLVRGQTEDICLYAVERNWTAIQHVREQTRKIAEAALKQSSDAKYYLVKELYDRCESDGID